MNRLADKVALVTGAASGLGRADARAMVEQGARVLLTDVNEGAGAEVAADLNRIRAGCAAFVVHDVRDERRWGEVVAECVRRFGGLNVLVNNAGVVVIATPETTTLEQFRFASAVMSEGVFLGCKAAIPALRASGGGSIINMSSVASHLGYPVFFAYSAAKGAVRAMTIRAMKVILGMPNPLRPASSQTSRAQKETITPVCCETGCATMLCAANCRRIAAVTEPIFQPALALAELPSGRMRCVTVGGRDVLICHTREGVFALDNICTHAFARMDEGRLRGARLICPLHGASFDVRDGRVLGAPASRPLRRHEVRIVEGMIEVAVAAGESPQPGAL